MNGTTVVDSDFLNSGCVNYNKSSYDLRGSTCERKIDQICKIDINLGKKTKKGEIEELK